MDPLITNGIEWALLRGLEKQGSEREPAPKRKRPPAPTRTVEEENEVESNSDATKHQLDDLA